MNCKNNLKNKYSEDDLLCPLCGKHLDDQKSMLICEEIRNRLKTDEIAVNRIKYEDIFDEAKKQKEITALYKKIIEIRNNLVEETLAQAQDPSTDTLVLETGVNLQPCIDTLSSGNLNK